MKCFAPTVAKRGMQLEFVRYQSNQPIRHLEQVSVKPVMAVVRSGTTGVTAPRKQ